MGGWDTTITQNTKITPKVVHGVLETMDQYVKDFNKFIKEQNVQEVSLGFPTGSTSYYKVDSPSTTYGDIDLQIVVPSIVELSGKTPSQVAKFWNDLHLSFWRELNPDYVSQNSTPGHPIIRTDNGWVQVDFMHHEKGLEDWGRYRTMPEHGVKGMLMGNLFSVLGDCMMLNIQHHGVLYKSRDGVRLPYAKTRHSKKNGSYDLTRVSDNIERFLMDILKNELTFVKVKYKKVRIHPLLLVHPGIDKCDVKTQDLVRGIVGLALTLEYNNMFGKNHLEEYSSADDFLKKFLIQYIEKATADIKSKKRDKAQTPLAKERALRDISRITEGLEKIKSEMDKAIQDSKAHNLSNAVV